MIIGKKLIQRLSALLSFSLVFGLVNTMALNPVVRAADAGWPASVLHGLNMPFRPADSLATTQNPPDFSWPYISGADSYHLQLSRDPAVTEVVYEQQALTVNFYNFPHVFDAGTWYWHVRFHIPDTGWSAWSDIRSFRIDPQNVPFPVPPIDSIMAGIPLTHPRVWTTQATLAEFKGLAQTVGSTVYETKRTSVMANLNNPLPAEPTFPYPPTYPKNDPAYVKAQQALLTQSNAAVNKMLDAAFIYLLTGSPEIGQHAKARLLGIASWNPNGATGYEVHDQAHRYITYCSAMAYDWLYDLLSESEKQQVRSMIMTRTETMMRDIVQAYPIQKYPYNSHGWTAFGYIGIIATSLLHDIPEAEDWYRQTVPAYINIMPPWGGEDGGWSQGTGYWQWSSMFGKEFMDVLLSSSGFNLYSKAYSRNEGLYPLYAFPHGSPKGIFGDDSEYAPGPTSVSMLNRLSQVNGDPRLKWEAGAIGASPRPELFNYFYGDPGLASRPPADLPRARWFKDIGLVAMHSELYDPDRISLYFKSSPYGSYNHSHADQNSFVINAFGESLAIEGGYYDFYGSVHDLGYGKQTFASNAITYDGKRGQPIDNIDADGRIFGFATHPGFDAVSGDAAAAYQGGLSQAQRHILYIRPSTFLVIDKLKTDKPGGSEFEWRLHAEDYLELKADQSGATIFKGNAALQVDFHSPQQLRTTYETKYLSMNGTEVKPTGAYAGEEQMHAAFITDRTNAATIVATMEAYRREGTPHNVQSENYGDYMLLTFEDGTVVYVRMTDGGEIDAGSIRFNGAALAVKGSSLLLVDGTKAVQDGVTIIDSAQPATIAYGDNVLSVSTPTGTQVALHAPAVSRVREQESGLDIPQGGPVAEAVGLRGVHWQTQGSTLTFQLEKGYRAFKLNEAPFPQPLGSVVLPIEIDGAQSSVTMQAYSDIEGVSVAWGKLTNEAGFYDIVAAPNGLTFEKYGRNQSLFLDADSPVIVRGAISPLKLKRVGSGSASDTVLWQNPDDKRATLSMLWQEAEAFAGSGGKTPSRYTTRPFLSGGMGMGDWDQTGQWVKWNFAIPKAGTYDIALKYVAGWDLPAGTQTARYAMLGDEAYYFEAPTTADYGTVPEHWRGLRIRTGKTLTPGPVELTMWNGRGGMNLDWIALIEVKDDEQVPTTPGNLRLVSQTDDSATLAWDASSDNADIREYVIYANGASRSVVPAGTHTATITGLAAGQSYTFTIRAVDTSDNRSPESSPLPVMLDDTTPPTWGAAASLRAARLFPNAVRLEWDQAADNSGNVVTYSVYRSGVSGSLASTVTGTTYDATGLQPGGTYTFKVEASDAAGNTSTDGPSITVMLPVTSAAFYDSFDDWAIGEATDGGGWTYTRSDGTIVSIVPLPNGGNTMKLTDNYYSTSNEYATSPVVIRQHAPMNGKVTVETRTKFSRLQHNVGNYQIDILGNGKIAAQFIGFSDGTFGYQQIVNGTTKSIRFPSASGYIQPPDQWMTVRFNIDFTARTYGITVQADAFKSYAGYVDPPGTLDKQTGIYRVEGIPFYDSSPSIVNIDHFRFRASRFTGIYSLDYVTMYPTE
ncbi:DUF4962 domain-containing protein [Paenibacillus ginsengarvi]|uniref:DUF4962 domain-containing protein n=1 Tax=Paenibacillus ginsengarvi TaxID=400777 RepID=A0A3B0CM21_9BACL|nr:DUF4962 domain-containing protein [Paenibacillus ginsengarvi]RKN86212.1 DUF4962 domain-containing protein [Paenibacillus ginsengarvi]